MKHYTPMKLIPPCKDYLWGGDRLKKEYGIQSDLDIVAESWELSCHKDGNSVIANGEFAGKTLLEFVQSQGNSVLGTNCASFENFPVLIKFIDAKKDLSVQVHPDNDYALRVEGEYGKTEMWYILDCDEGASLLYGFREAISPEEFRRRIEENTLLEVTNRVPVHPGDVFFIDAGTLHAIGSGILIAEIQQNSNTTYRIYDYGRLGADGKPRALHIEKALEVTSLTPPTREPKPMGEPQQMDGYCATLLGSCEYFHVEKLELQEKALRTAGEDSFLSYLCIEGSAKMTVHGETFLLQKGDSYFLPAGSGEIYWEGKAVLLETKL